MTQLRSKAATPPAGASVGESRGDEEGRERILCMDPAVADQIAAGEVIERPASALKEMVDNAVDAGARRIEIELEGGGATRLLVWDDGRGIHAEDLPLAVLRHATSKLRHSDDLLSISTLGFRGEALASLAAVAQLKIRSRPAQSELGQELVCRPGQAPEQRSLGMPKGTQVEMSALFAQIPARKKFLRAEATEVAHCVDAVLKIALLHPEIAFVLRNGRRSLLNLSAHERRTRVEAILGRRAKGPFLPFSGEAQGISVWGVAAPGEQGIRQSQGLYLAVRKRVIRDRNMSRIVNQAFGDSLGKGRYPVAFVEIEAPAESVDINVHPQKSEVRFSDAQRVYAAMREVLQRELLPQLRGEDRESQADRGSDRIEAGAAERLPAKVPVFESLPVSAATDTAERSSSLQDLVQKGVENAERSPAKPMNYRLSTRAQGPGYARKKADMKREVQALRSALESGRKFERSGRLFRDEQLDPAGSDTVPGELLRPDASRPESAGPACSPTIVEDTLPESTPGEELCYLSMLPGLRALFEVKGELWVVELRRLRSHLVEQKLRAQWGDAQTIGVQQLLKALVIRPPAQTLALCLRHRADLLRLGIDLEAFGDGALVVRGVPVALGSAIEAQAVLGMLEQLRPWLNLRAMDGCNQQTAGSSSAQQNKRPKARRESNAGQGDDGHQGAFAAVAELAPLESSPRSAPRLARRWLQEALAQQEGQRLPGVSIWSADQLCRKPE